MGYDEEEDYDEMDDEEEDEVDDELPVKTKGLSRADKEFLKNYLHQRQSRVKLLSKTATTSDEVDETDEDPSEVDSLAYNPLPMQDFMSFQNTNRDKASKVYAEALKLHGPSPGLLNSMLSVHANALRLQTAIKFFREEYAKYDISPDIFTYRSLMRMYIRSKRPEHAVALIKELHTNGMEINS